MTNTSTTKWVPMGSPTYWLFPHEMSDWQKVESDIIADLTPGFIRYITLGTREFKVTCLKSGFAMSPAS